MAIASASRDAKLKKNEILLCPLPNWDFRSSVRTVSNKPPDTDTDCDKHRVDQFSQEMARSANSKILTGFLNFSARLYNFFVVLHMQWWG